MLQNLETLLKNVLGNDFFCHETSTCYRLAPAGEGGSGYGQSNVIGVNNL